MFFNIALYFLYQSYTKKEGYLSQTLFCIFFKVKKEKEK